MSHKDYFLSILKLMQIFAGLAEHMHSDKRARIARLEFGGGVSQF